MEFKDIITQAGAAYDTVLNRFGGNEGLLKKFIFRFPQDPNFEDLKKQVAEKDYEGIERSAHTIKGVAANLGFDKLSAACGEVVKAVREGRLDGIPALFEKVSAEYQFIVDSLKDAQ